MNGHEHGKCREVMEHLDEYLDRELSEEDIAMLESHFEDCSACAEHAEFERAMLECVRKKVERLCAPKELLDRIRLVLDEIE